MCWQCDRGVNHHNHTRSINRPTSQCVCHSAKVTVISGNGVTESKLSSLLSCLGSLRLRLTLLDVQDFYITYIYIYIFIKV